MKTRTAPSQGTGRAGRRGEGVRSDLAVTLELCDKGQLQIDLTSKVAAYYEEAIREQVLSILKNLKIEHAQIVIDDAGALPFVIAARVEASSTSLLGNIRGKPARVILRSHISTMSQKLPACLLRRQTVVIRS